MDNSRPNNVLSPPYRNANIREFSHGENFAAFREIYIYFTAFFGVPKVHKYSQA